MCRDRHPTGAADGASRADGEGGVAASDLFEVLADPSRRCILRQLRGTDGRLCVHELADQLAGDRTTGEHSHQGTDGCAGGSRRAGSDPVPADRLAIGLHHSHLPKLGDCGLVDYDPESHTVASEIPSWVEPYLDVVADD